MALLWAVAVLTLAQFGFLLVNSLQFPCHNCPDAQPSGTCNFVDIEPCTKQPCSLKKGTTVKVSVSFTSNKAADNLTAEVHGKVMGLWLPFPLPNPNVCKSNVQCPVASGQTSLYENELVIQELFPAINVVVKWELKDQDNNSFVCVVVPASIVA